MKTTHLLRSSALITVGTAFSRLTGFLRVGALAYALGFSRLTDTYNLANETPNMLYELLLGGVLTAVLVPTFVDFFERDDDESPGIIISTATTGLVAFSAIGVLAAPLIVRIYTFRLEGAERVAQQEVATDLLRFFAPQILFYGLVALTAALLNARRRFMAAAFSPAINNVVVGALLIFIPTFFGKGLGLRDAVGDNGFLVYLGLGTTAGIAAMATVQLIAVARSGAKLRFRPSFTHPSVRRLVRLSGWTAGYVVANQITVWVVLVLANGRAGGVSAYLAAFLFFMLPYGLLAYSIMTTFTPELASAVTQMDEAALRWRYAIGARLLVLVMAPATAAYLALAQPIVTGLLERGAFEATQAELTANTVATFAIGLVPFSIYLFSLRIWYAHQNTRIPFFVNTVQNVCNIILALVFFKLWSVPGLGLSFAVSYGLAACLVLVLVRQKLGSIDGKNLADTTLRAGIAAGIAGVVAWYASQWWDPTGWTSSLVSVAVIGLLAIFMYGAGLVVLRVREVQFARGLIKAKRAHS